MTPYAWFILFLTLITFVGFSGVSNPGTNEDFIRSQWEKANRWLRNGKIDWEEYQWWIESERNYIGEEEWNYWMRIIRRDKRLLYGKHQEG